MSFLKQAFVKHVFTPVAEAYSAAMKYQTKPDTYGDFLIVAAEVATRKNVDLKQSRVLANQEYYVVTALSQPSVDAVAEGSATKVKERKFLVTAEQMGQLGLNTAQAVKDAGRMICDKSVTFTTLGPYREPITKVYPRVQSVDVGQELSADKVAEINAVIKKAPRDRNFKFGVFGM